MHKTFTLAIALLCCGCQDGAAPPVSSPVAPPVAAERPRDALVDHVWVRADSAELPGRKLIFLSDGTLVQDSCWETYRLSKWSRASANHLVWSEDTAEVEAEIRALSEDELVLKLVKPDEPEEQHFTRAAVPYVCPDMKR